MENKYRDHRTLFLEILAANILSLRQELGSGWEEYESRLRLLLEDLQEPGADTNKIVDRVVRLILSSSAGRFAQICLREARRMAGYNVQTEEWSLRDNTEVTTETIQKVLSYLHSSPTDSVSQARAGRLVLFAIRHITRDAVSQEVGSIGVSETRSESAVRSSMPSSTATAPQQHLTARTQEQVKLGEIFSLIVRVSTEPLPNLPGASTVPMPNFSGRLTINVHGSGIDFLEGSMRMLDVPVKGDSTPVNFMLKALSEGVHRMEITAWNSSAYVAGLTLWIAVDTPPSLGGEESLLNMREPEKGEYTLEIVFEKEHNRYRFHLRGESVGVLKAAYSDALTGPLQAHYETLLSSLNVQARNLNLLSSKMQAYWLKGLGTLMAEHLMPEELRRTLWEIRDGIRRLNIMCDGDPLPWELIYIASPSGGDGVFLAENAGVARLRYGPPPPTKIRAISPHFVHPKGSPTQTAEEIEKLRILFPDAVTVKKMDELMNLLMIGGFGLLHFASHNNLKPGDAGSSYVPFENAKFDLVFMGNVARGKYRQTSPLVFMNACTSAGKAPLFTEMSSWADRYLNSGAGAFVGSLWEVRDRSAPEFAFAFYKKLKQGGTLGEAMMAGRGGIETPDGGDPTRLAFTLYGNPLARLES
jgi:hypothetical protein